MQFRREAYLALMRFERTERPMFCELFGPLVGLEEEWRAQGATAEELDLTAFDFDYLPVVRCGGETGAFGLPPARVLEETDEYAIRLDGLGRRVKLYKRSASIYHPLDFPVRTMDDWRRLRPFFTFRDERIDWEAVAAAQAAQAAGALVVAGLPGGFGLLRDLMGEEVACLAYYDQPELVHDILDTAAATALAVLERVTERLVIDQLSAHEDLAGKSGPLIGPKQVREFTAPYYRRVWDLLGARGARLFDVDSDGNVNPILGDLTDAGVNVLHPNEPAAGMDIVAIRHQYGRRLALKGGIDKHVLRQDQPAIRAELERKIPPLLHSGGLVFGLDHRIPNGTPLANYRFYVDTARAMLGLPPRDPAHRGWARMAF
jgi:uroporphyrinogen-III decarboxylase